MSRNNGNFDCWHFEWSGRYKVESVKYSKKLNRHATKPSIKTANSWYQKKEFNNPGPHQAENEMTQQNGTAYFENHDRKRKRNSIQVTERRRTVKRKRNKTKFIRSISLLNLQLRELEVTRKSQISRSKKNVMRDTVSHQTPKIFSKLTWQMPFARCLPNFISTHQKISLIIISARFWCPQMA